MADLILALNDLAFLSRIRAAAEAEALDWKRATTPAELMTALREAAPVAIIFDLHHMRLEPMRMIAEVRERGREIWTIGYFSHLQSEVGEGARRAGCDLVLPRSAFIARLPDLMREVAARKRRRQQARRR